MIGNVFSRHYRTFRTQNDKYNTKPRKFLVKFVGVDLGDDYENYIKRVLSPVEVVYVSKPKLTYLGENPVDFPLVAYDMMTTFELHTRGSIIADDIKMLFYENMKLPFKYYHITNLNDPTNANTVDYQKLINQIEGKDEDYFPSILGYEPEDDGHSKDEKDFQDIVGNKRITKLFNEIKKIKDNKK